MKRSGCRTWVPPFDCQIGGEVGLDTASPHHPRAIRKPNSTAKGPPILSAVTGRGARRPGLFLSQSVAHGQES